MSVEPDPRKRVQDDVIALGQIVQRVFQYGDRFDRRVVPQSFAGLGAHGGGAWVGP
jgi:hypothetical protein